LLLQDAAPGRLLRTDLAKRWQAARLTALLTLGESGASKRRHLHDHRGPALHAPTDVPELLGAALVLARHFGPHRAGVHGHDLEVALGPLEPRFPCGELLLSRLQLDKSG
jgi:hypothetical protein